MSFEPEDVSSLLREPGQTSEVRGKRAVCSTDNAIVTAAILRVLEAGGNAIDAAIAGCMVQAAVEPFMTNHTGTVSCIYYEAATRSLHSVDSVGIVPAGMPAFKPVPGVGKYSFPGAEPVACLPGFMPGLKAMFGRFGSRPWASLCEEAIHWAEHGHPVSNFEYRCYAQTYEFHSYFPEARALFLPGGQLPPVGKRFRNPALAQTLRQVASGGADEFISGGWAKAFVAKANEMGWPITLAHLAATAPAWREPQRYGYRGHEIVQLPPPQSQAVFCALVLGMLDHVEGADGAPDSAEAVHAMAHALRLGRQLCGFVNDPNVFAVPLDELMDGGFHRSLGKIIEGARPRADLSEHVRLTWGPTRMAAAGMPYGRAEESRQPAGSCELAVVDEHGNWVQMMNTLQGGGIPGQVVGGVPMVGAHSTLGSMASSIDSWLAPGARTRSVMGNTIVLKDGAPRFSLGSPGNIHCTAPQVLANILLRGMDYVPAVEAPRMLPLGDDYSLSIETRLPVAEMRKLTRMGLKLTSEVEFDYHMGSFQMAWREANGDLGANADFRRCGVADGLARL